MTPRLGVTGVTGELGGRVARRLADRGVAQRLVVRDRARAPELAGAEVVEFGGYDDPEGLRRAFDGLDTLFLVSAGEAPDRVRLHTTAVDAAVAAGVRRVVYTSFLGAAPEATFTFARDHFHTEQHIRGTGLAHTFLRSSMYLDFVPVFVGAGGTIKAPAGTGRVAMVARDDIADVAAVVLTGDEHAGQAYEVTGRERLSLAEVTAVLSEVIGRKVEYQEETVEEARASRAGYGAPAWEVEGWVTSYAAIATGELDVLSDTVLRLTGHEPMTLAEYLRANPQSWRQLVTV